MTGNIQVAIIGYGYATATFHAPLVLGVPGLELVAISSSDPGKVHAAHPGLCVMESPEALLSRPDIELIVIPTPNATHYPLARRALAAGKHVVVDKPFTVSMAEAHELKDTAVHLGRVLSVFHNRRWDSDFLTLKQVLRSGALGRIAHFESHFDRYRPQLRNRWKESPGAGSGLWYDLGPHLLDQAIQLFGMPDSIDLDLAAQRDGAQVDDWFHAVLRYGPMRAILHAGVLVPEPGPRYIVHGDKGTFTKRGLDPQEDLLKTGVRPPLPGWGADAVAAELTLREGDAFISQRLPCQPGDYLAYYEGVRDAIRGCGPIPVTADEAIAVLSLIEEALCRRQARD
jgi:scyllo-inositol 2-dehydrogenase (NADP+)